MANLSINQIVSIIEDIATRHKQINDFGYGQTHQIGDTRPMNYPYLWVTLQPSNIANVNNRLNTVELEMTFIVADYLSNVDSSAVGQKSTNGLEITSDLQLILFDIITEINSHPFYTTNRISIKSDVSISPTYDERDDNVNAWAADVTITMPFNHTYCSTPIDYTTFGGGGNGVYTPITVTINDSAFTILTTSPSNIVVKDTDGTVVGSKVGTEWIVPGPVLDLTTKFYFEIGNDLSPIITIDASTAGTYTSIADDGASGVITLDIDSGGFSAFVNPTTFAIGQTLQLQRTITTAIGNVTLTGTYV